MSINVSAKVSIRDYNKLVKNIERRTDKAARIASEFTKAKIQKDIPSRVAALIVNSVFSHKVMLGLLGANAGDESGDDLQAEFGLIGEELLLANDIQSTYINKSAYQLRGPIMSQSKKSTRVRYELDFFPEGLEGRMLGKPYAENEAGVPWLQWSFEKFADMDQGYNIMYKSHFKGSRTGRALMVENFGLYSIPDIVKTGTGNTWLKEAVASAKAQVSKEIEAMLREVVKNNFKKAFRNSK